MRNTLHKQRGWAWLAWAAPAAAKLAGEVMGQDDQRKAMHEQMDAQKEFAQMGIRWRVADAKAAGVHPLYALGAQTHSFSPMSVGDRPNVLGEMGQDISSAIARGQSQEERRQELARQTFRQAELDQMNRETHAANLRGLELANANTELRNAALFQQLNAPTQTGPGMPNAISSPVRTPEVEAIEIQPSKITSRSRFDSSSTAGSHPGNDRVEIAPNEWVRLPTTEQGERMEGLGEFWKAVLAPYFWFRGEHGADWDRRWNARRSTALASRYRHLQDRGVYPRRKGM